MVLPALLETLNIAVAATLLGGAGAAVLSLAATPNLGAPAWLRLPVRRCLDVMRAFPELIIALFLIFVLGTSPVPAMIAVAFHTVGALGKLFSEVNENIDVKPMEGLAASGGCCQPYPLVAGGSGPMVATGGSTQPPAALQMVSKSPL